MTSRPMATVIRPARPGAGAAARGGGGGRGGGAATGMGRAPPHLRRGPPRFAEGYVWRNVSLCLKGLSGFETILPQQPLDHS